MEFVELDLLQKRPKVSKVTKMYLLSYVAEDIGPLVSMEIHYSKYVAFSYNERRREIL